MELATVVEQDTGDSGGVRYSASNLLLNCSLITSTVLLEIF
ncbi:hypothetical protein NIES2104_65120 [Leptolyngbya sp. NIES-2104]|nr:hypothetical protein NIES2104_65120 [Leptolyngbya sp. NIES-2104]